MRSDSALNRRHILGILAGGLLASGMRPGEAAEARIAHLIEQAHAKGSISQRIDFISAALRGTRYLGFTLVGGPRRPEHFVARDDGFDCVTFCETVVAAAIAENPGEFDSVLRKIRYHNGIVNWRERNHYFFEWGQHNIENGVCQAVDIPGSIEIQKTVYWHRELGRRLFSMTVVPAQPSWPTSRCSPAEISSALLRNGRTWTTFMSALLPSAATANCCCGTLRKAGGASSMSA